MTAALRMLWCGLGAAVAMGLVLWLVLPPEAPLLFAPLGASAMFLFGLTRMPAAQPRALLGGHLGTALIGLLCYRWCGDAVWVYALAEALALWCMLGLRVMHPPAGANPILVIHAHAGFDVLWFPMAAGLLTLVAVACLWSRLYPGQPHYPRHVLEPSPTGHGWGSWEP